MPDPAVPTDANPAAERVDHDRLRGDKPFDRPDHFTGEDYDIGRELVEGSALPSGQEDRVATGGDLARPRAGDNRASFDPRTGEVQEPRLPEDGGLPSPRRP